MWTAVQNDDARIVRVLLDAGANCNIRDRSGDTLLQSAIWAESNRCLLSSESTMTSAFPDCLMPVPISRTVLSKK